MLKIYQVHFVKLMIVEYFTCCTILFKTIKISLQVSVCYWNLDNVHWDVYKLILGVSLTYWASNPEQFITVQLP